jgi:DNA-nicking Smr family endonuclease
MASSAHSDDEFELFRSMMSDVVPHRSQAREGPLRAPPSTRPRQQELDEMAVIAELIDGPDPETFDTGETLAYRADGVQDSLWRRLRRGSFRIQAELDLHGLNREKARHATAAFLQRCRDRDHRCVRIIHGKGNGSPNSGPVLKVALDGWLRRRRDVLAFASARPEHGGTGAVYVLLRAPT